MEEKKKERCTYADCWEPGAWRPHRCSNKAKRDGFCGIHHPDAVKARKKKADDRYEASNARLEARNEVYREQGRQEMRDKYILTPKETP